MSDTLSTSVNTTQEEISITTIRTNKNGRSQTINPMELKSAPPKSSTTRFGKINLNPGWGILAGVVVQSIEESPAALM